MSIRISFLFQKPTPGLEQLSLLQECQSLLELKHISFCALMHGFRLLGLRLVNQAIIVSYGRIHTLLQASSAYVNDVVLFLCSLQVILTHNRLFANKRQFQKSIILQMRNILNHPQQKTVKAMKRYGYTKEAHSKTAEDAILKLVYRQLSRKIQILKEIL